MNLFNYFFLYGVVIMVQLVLQLSFVGRFTGRKVRFWHYAIYIMLFYAITVIGTFAQSDLLNALLNLLILYGTSRLFLKNSRLISSFTSVLGSSVMGLSFGTVNALQSILWSYVIDLGLIKPVMIAASVLSLALCFLSFRFITQHFSLKTDEANHYLVMLFVPVLFFCVMGFYITNIAYGNETVIPFPHEPQKHIEMLVLQTLGFCSLFSTLYAYGKLCESFRIRERIALLEQETNAQRVYVSEAKARYERTQAFRHDIKNHLSVLNGLLKHDRTDQAKNFLEKLEFVTKDLSFPIHTGNPVIDILLGSKIEIAKQNGIRTELFFLLPQSCNVDDLDLCIIFSNALDNAINACIQVDGGKMLRITGERQGDFYRLEFENSCLPRQGALKEFGTGLSNIKAVADKYGGVITAETNSSIFCLDILLNISLHSDCITTQNY